MLSSAAAASVLRVAARRPWAPAEARGAGPARLHGAAPLPAGGRGRHRAARQLALGALALGLAHRGGRRSAARRGRAGLRAGARPGGGPEDVPAKGLIVVAPRGRGGGNTVFSKGYRENAFAVDLSSTSQILELEGEGDPVMRCGAAVTMEALAAAALRRGLAPLVLPELRGITVGGAVMGGGVESGSHRHGLFTDTCAWLLLRRGDGQVVRLRPGDEGFADVDSSFGTLCTLLEAGVRCRRCGPRVRLSFRFVEDDAEAGSAAGAAELQRASEAPGSPELLDALHLPAGWDGRGSRGGLLLMQGEDAPESAGERVTWSASASGPWFFEHAVEVARRLRRSGGSHRDIMSASTYFFRYDYGAFWMARPLRWSPMAVLREPHLLLLFLSCSPLLRPLLGWMFTTRRLFRALHAAPLAGVNRKLVICDFFVPVGALGGFVDMARREVPIDRPFWICPARVPAHGHVLGPHGHLPPGSLTVCVGTYGRVRDGRGADHTELLERTCIAAGGRKMMYGANRYSRREFDAIYDSDGGYTAARERWGATARFPHMFDKTCGGNRGPGRQKWPARLRDALLSSLL